ncbi:MAG: hypothetical protein ACOX2R_06160 [Anaerolineae bacterium]|jgi:hypothetical protein
MRPPATRGRGLRPGHLALSSERRRFGSTRLTHSIRWAVALSVLLGCAALLAACGTALTPTIPLVADPTSAFSATATPTLASATPEPTATEPPTATPTPEGAVTLVILHTTDVFGQMDPCG